MHTHCADRQMHAWHVSWHTYKWCMHAHACAYACVRARTQYARMLYDYACMKYLGIVSSFHNVNKCSKRRWSMISPPPGSELPFWTKKCRNHPLFRHFAETAEILPKNAEILVSRPQFYCFHPLFDAICDSSRQSPQFLPKFLQNEKCWNTKQNWFGFCRNLAPFFCRKVGRYP